MVSDLTLGNEKWQAGWDAADNVNDIAIPIFSKSLQLANQDSAAFDEVMAAFKLPKGNDDEIEARRAEIRRATLVAAQVPLETARASLKLLQVLTPLAEFGNANAISDVGVSSLLASAACKGALMNVEINLSSLPDDMGAAERAECASIKNAVSDASRESVRAVSKRL
jgi:formiminotetrahydrofolate cyclodeaminase